VGVVAFDPKHWSAEPRKQPLPAREDDDLHPSGSTCHDVEHLFDTIVVGKDESIIKNNCCRPLLIEQELSKPEASQHCDLFLGALTESRKLFLLAIPPSPRDVKILVENEIRRGSSVLRYGSTA
jgi:hypothetical protein